MQVTFKPRDWSEVKVGDVVTFRQYRGIKSIAGVLRYMRVYEISTHKDSHGVEHVSASLTGTYLTKKGQRHGVLNPPTYAGVHAYADYVRIGYVDSVTGTRDWVEDVAEAYDAAHAENAEREIVEAAVEQATLRYARFSAAVVEGKSYRAALDLLHAEAADEAEERAGGWGQPDGMLGTVEADLPQHCGQRWVAEIEKCYRCGLDAAAHADIPADALLQADLFTGISDRAAAAAALADVANLRMAVGIMETSLNWPQNTEVKAALDRIEAALRGAR